MSEILTKREKTDLLKSRVEVIKGKLKPIKNWKADFFKLHKEYDSHYWSIFLRNMMTGATTDEQLIEALENYITSLELQ